MPSVLPFHRLGRNAQPAISSPSHLLALVDVDDALWVASAVPVDTIRADKGFLDALDTDADGRIRSDELRAAIRWTFSVLSDTADLAGERKTLRLATLNDSADAATCKEAAKRILADSGTPGASEISLDAVRALRADEEKRGLSAAGRILPAAAGDDAVLALLINEAIRVTGGVPHPAGDKALDEASLVAYLDQAKAWLAWLDEAELPPEGTTPVYPAGPGTGAAISALDTLHDKLAQYFMLCDAVRLDAALADRARVDASNTDLLDTAAATALLSRAPLATPRPDGKLDLEGALNPVWHQAVQTLREAAVVPLLGEQTLLIDRAAIAALQAALAPHREWQARKPATLASESSADVLREHLADEASVTKIRALLAESEVAAVVLDGVKLLERLIANQAWLLPFTTSFACTPALYDANASALFEQGELVMDGRRFGLCLKVNDAPRAEKFAAASPMFIMFVMVGEKGTAWEYQVAVPVTAGERGHLVEGMWGVYYDIDGRELHAQVRKIAVSPISIKEAVLAPFRRIGDAIQSALDKSASAQSESMSTAATSKATAAADAASSAPTSLTASGEAAKAAAAAPPGPAGSATPAAPPAAKPEAGGMGGQLPMIIAGGGVAFAALAGALTYAIQLFWTGAGALAEMLTSLPFIEALGAGMQSIVQIIALPLAVIVILLGVMLVPLLVYLIPVSLATWFRLRRRDLATLLEGSGWAINTRLYLDRDLAERLTSRPPIPKG